MRARAFSAFTLLLLAIAIGSTTGIFSLLEALALRNLPVTHPEQLLQLVVPRSDDPESHLTVTQFREIERRQQVFSAMFGAESHFVGTIDIAQR
jgi:putative ABC transport system permease protein